LRWVVVRDFLLLKDEIVEVVCGVAIEFPPKSG